MKKNGGEDPTAGFLKDKMGTSYSSIQHKADRVLNGKTEFDLFLPWYKRYLEEVTGIHIHEYAIELMDAGYGPGNKIVIYSTELISTWKQ